MGSPLVGIKRARSRNAYKHGLAAQAWAQHDEQRIATLTEILKEGRSGNRIEQAAKRAAEARDYLERVIAVADEILAAAQAGSPIIIAGKAILDRPGAADACCANLSRLQRYERRATLQCERALAELEIAQLDK